jgi:YaiO family outer membrane protein
VSISSEYEEFDENTDPWTFTYAEYGHRFAGFGSVILRVDQADRFQRDGAQYEIDAYPSLGKGLYAYLNFGASGSSLFPQFRYGAQIYKSLPHSYEVSLGARYLDFESSNVTIWTGSIGKYKGNYFIWLTPYVVNGDGGTSASGVLQLRRYYGDGDTYWSLRGGYGSAPDVDTLLQITTHLDNWSVSAGRRWALAKNTFLDADLGYRDREYSQYVHRKSVFIDIGVKYRF